MKPLYFKYDKYLPYNDYDTNSTEEVLAVLKKQSELIERRGLTLTQNIATWTNINASISINGIFQDRLTPYHDHDYYEANYVYDGQLAQYIEGKELIMRKGDFLLLPPSVRHASFPIGENSRCVNILFNENVVKKTEKHLSTHNTTNYLNFLMNHKTYMLFVNTGNFGIDSMINECQDLRQNKTMEYSELIIDLVAEKMLITLANCERYDQLFNTGIIADSKERDDRILQYMSEHYADITLEKLAKKFGYSTQHIRRIIKKNTGYSFIVALQHTRINKAMNLLTTTTLPIKEITELVGLESPEYFTRRFKVERGITPTEYRNAHMAKKEN